MNSIRISSHHSRRTHKKRVFHKYNLLSCVKNIMHDHRRYGQHYFPAEDWKLMVEFIIDKRKRKRMKLGNDLYERIVQRNRDSASSRKRGFWTRAKEVF